MTPLAWSTAGLLFASATANAAETVSIALRGFVPETSSVKLLEVNPVVSNDLRAAIRSALVARVEEQSNSLSGYSIKLISESGQRGQATGLVNAQAGMVVPYTLSYGGEPLRFVNGQAELQRARTTRGERTRESDLRISTDGSDRIVTGEYIDTITIAITAR